MSDLLLSVKDLEVEFATYGGNVVLVVFERKLLSGISPQSIAAMEVISSQQHFIRVGIV